MSNWRDWRDSPWYFVVGGVAIVVGALIAIAGDGAISDWLRWLAAAGIVISLAIPAAVLWRKHLRGGRGRHGM
jgi:hypothetical protein